MTTAFEVPYSAVIVDLAEGWQMLSNLIEWAHDDCYVGMDVRVQFPTLDDDVTLPCFRPA